MSNREEFLTKMESQLKVWRAQLAQIGSQTEDFDQEEKRKFAGDFDDLKLRIREFEDRINAVSDAEGDHWRRMQSEVEDLKNAVGQTIGSIASAINELLSK